MSSMRFTRWSAMPPAYPRRVAVKDTTNREERVREQRRGLPDAPGVYLFKDEKGKVLYVGKAKSIRKRVAGHFTKPGTTRGSVDMTGEIADIDFVVTQTEA